MYIRIERREKKGIKNHGERGPKGDQGRVNENTREEDDYLGFSTVKSNFFSFSVGNNQEKGRVRRV